MNPTLTGTLLSLYFLLYVMELMIYVLLNWQSRWEDQVKSNNEKAVKVA